MRMSYRAPELSSGALCFLVHFKPPRYFSPFKTYTMYTGMLHTHTLVVTLFLLHYAIKTALLLGNKTEQLAGYTRKTRIAEMGLSVLFLATGAFLVVKGPEVSTLLMLKLVAVFASIPLAVIGFKRQKKALAVVSFLLLVMAYGLAEMGSSKKVKKQEVASGSAVGKGVYEAYCTRCHGADGKANLAGAKDLSISVLTLAETKTIVSQGKGLMPGHEAMISEAELDSVVAYAMTLRR